MQQHNPCRGPVRRGITLFFLCLFSISALAERSYELNLGGLSFDPLTDFPQLDSGGHHARGTEPNFHLIQFDGPIQGQWLSSARDHGMEIVQYIHPYTYVVWADQAVLNSARNVAGVRWAGEFAAEFRVIPEQRGFTEPNEATWISISRYADARAVSADLQAAGFEVLEITPFTRHFNLVKATGPGQGYMDLARMPAVYTVQHAPVIEYRGEMSNQSVVGNYGPEPDHEIFPGYASWLTDTGYDGSGVIVSIMDNGIRESHQDLAPNMLPCVSQGSPTSCTQANGAHGTHVAGAVAGTGDSGITDSAGFLRGQGVAPGANLVQQRHGSIGSFPWGAQCNNPSPPDGGYCLSPNHMLILFKEAALSGATHANNSWGSLGFQIGYDLPTQQLDAMVRDSNPDTPDHEPVLPVWSIQNGNGDRPGSCSPSSLGSPDEAKNLFGIGSTRLQPSVGNQFPNIFDVSPNSAHGPACDGRTGLHIVAPGCSTDSTDSGSDTAFAMGCGTSMASPVVSGAVALFIERHRDLYGADPSPALIKAALTAVATNMHGNLNADGGTITETPSRFQGYGRLDLEAVVNPPRNVIYFDQEHVFTATGQEWAISLVAENPDEPMRVMLMYTDAHGPGLAGSTPAWVNDLDLVVEAGADTYLGNVLGSDGFSETGGVADGMNNAEAVFLRPDQHNGAAFTITVEAVNIAADALNPHNPDPANPTQDFALVCYNCIQGEPRSLGGEVQDLAGAGLVLQNNGGNDLEITGNGPFIFTAPVFEDQTYDVTVAQQPSAPAQTCEVDNGQGTVGEDDITDVLVTCQMAPDLVVTPPELEFGTLVAGQTQSLELQISNAGAETAPDLVLDEIQITDGAEYFAVTGGDCQPDMALEAGASCTAEISFMPMDEGDFTGAVEITSQDGQSVSVELSGSASAAPPGELEVSPQALDFGEVPVGDSALLEVTLSNVAPEYARAVELESIELIAGAPEFEVVSDDCDGVVAAQDHCTVVVRYAPGTSGANAGLLRISTAEEPAATVNVSLAGSGIEDVRPPLLFQDRFETVE